MNNPCAHVRCGITALRRKNQEERERPPQKIRAAHRQPDIDVLLR